MNQDIKIKSVTLSGLNDKRNQQMESIVQRILNMPKQEVKPCENATHATIE